jgi:hypothetical protein
MNLGSTTDKIAVLAMHTMQFGKYFGQTFGWVLSNDASYVAYLMAEYAKERKPAAAESRPDTASQDRPEVPEGGSCYWMQQGANVGVLSPRPNTPIMEACRV